MEAFKIPVHERMGRSVELHVQLVKVLFSLLPFHGIKLLDVNFRCQVEVYCSRQSVDGNNIFFKSRFTFSNHFSFSTEFLCLDSSVCNSPKVERIRSMLHRSV